MKVLSLGWGVQSFTIAAMAALGEIESFDVAIHADTTHESILTYQFISRWHKWLTDHGLKVVTVSAIDTNILSKHNRVMPPAYTKGNSKGILHRQCTNQWKIRPIRKWIWNNHIKGEQVFQLIGISLDEYQRMRPSGVKYITNQYPLIDRKMTRNDCIKWLKDNSLEIPAKSACSFCPYHSNDEWLSIQNTPEDRINAINADKLLRNSHHDYVLFIHPKRLPIDIVFDNLSIQSDNQQLNLWSEECTGLCGL